MKAKKNFKYYFFFYPLINSYSKPTNNSRLYLLSSNHPTPVFSLLVFHFLPVYSIVQKQ